VVSFELEWMGNPNGTPTGCTTVAGIKVILPNEQQQTALVGVPADSSFTACGQTFYVSPLSTITN
jgi:hypothetical protein